jgi:predicted MFS family arabinose efflux permease
LVAAVNSALRLQLILFSLVRIVFNTMHRMVYPYLGEFSRGLGVGLPELSRLFAVRSVAGGISPLLVFFVDRWGRRSSMLFGLALIVLGAGALVVWQTLTAFALALVVTTIGYHVFVPEMQAYLGDEVPYRQRGVALAVTEFGWSLSFILGVPLMGLLIARAGWASPYPLLALLALVGLLALVRLLPKQAPQPISLDRGVVYSLRVVFTAPAALAGLAVSMLMTCANEMVNLVFGLWMDTSFGLKIAALGGVAVGIGMAELGGEVLVSAWADRLGKHRAVALGLMGNILAALGFLLLGGSRWGSVVALFFFYLTFEFTIVSSLPMMTEVLPTARASLMAVNIAMIALGRAVGAPLGALLYTLALPGLPAIAPNALAVVVFNLLALAALALLLRWWHPGEG